MPKHRPNSPVDKALRRFYEPLVLLFVIDPSRDVVKPDLISDRGLNEQAKLWRNFLDQSSFLCDSDKGGDTVTSIAAQRTYEQPVFWLASNSDSHSRHKAKDHFKWILTCLEDLYNERVTDTEVANRLFDQCVVFSSKRIKVYANWLCTAIDKAEKQKKHSMRPEDEELFTTLQEFRRRAHDHHDLCAFAYTCRSDKSIQILSQRHNAQNRRNIWSEIRHLVGRLGMWSKAVKVLVLGARRFPQYIENASVKTISPETKANILNADHLTDLGGIVNRMLPKTETASADMLIKALTDLDNVAGVWENFREKYSDAKPRPHAELLVLEEFHRGEFEFLNEDRYIGCSKPSCYCCYLYIQFHPGRFSPRPCHGNLWLNWAPPIPLPVGSDRQSKGKSRVQDHPSFKMLQQMLVPIRQDLQEQILSRRPRRQRLPDSSTGMSSIAHLIQQIDEVMATPSLTTGQRRSSSLECMVYEAESMNEDDDRSSVAIVISDPVPSGNTSNSIESVERQTRSSMSSDDEDVLVFKGRQFMSH